jgi:hypothetical protein
MRRSEAKDSAGIRLAVLMPIVLLIASALLLACGGPPSSPGASETTTDLPEITDELIYERINDAWVRDVPEETGTSPPISWNFDHDEPKEITVVDKQQNGARATIVLDVKTSSAPRARANRQLTGQIRTDWELQTGWVMRRWEIVDTENISMKYKDLAKPSPGPNSKN